MDNFDLLENSDCWVNMEFSDGTIQSIHTTLNTSLLSKYGATTKIDHFFDLDRGIFVPFRKDATSVTISKEKPQYDKEVLQFASRFI